jgi:predicted NBD/HSP70 family sugar kinase
MALGEHWYGAGKGTGDMIIIDIDAGIGASAISDGRIVRGRHSMEGEMGHNLIIPDGPLCICGKRGCLEAVASGSAIISKIRHGLKEGIKSNISDLINSPSTRMAIRAVFQAAKEGDEFANQVINEAGYYLGLAIAVIINYTDPELVVLTGCVTSEGKGMLLKIIKDVVYERVVDSSSRTIRIEEGVLGDNATLIGAATLVYREAFRLPLVHS